MNYRYYIEQLDSEDTCIHTCDDVNPDDEITRPILLISNSFHATGAPIQLLCVADCLHRHGWNVFALSVADGILTDDFLLKGATVLIYNNPENLQSYLDVIPSLFPVIFVNTLTCSPYVLKLAPLCRRVFWWFHESSYMYRPESTYKLGLTPSLTALACSEQAAGIVGRHIGRSAHVLDVVINDEYSDTADSHNDNIARFLWVGNIDFNKAPHILLEAVSKLSPDVLSVCSFTICGKTENSGELGTLIDEFAALYPNINVLPRQPHERVINLMRSHDCVIVSSLEETASLVGIEALMMKKLLIISDRCGITSNLTDGVNAYIFPSGDSRALADKIMSVVVSSITPPDLPKGSASMQVCGTLGCGFQAASAMAENGRNVYLANYTSEQFTQSLLNILNNSDIINDNMNLCCGCGACANTCPHNAIYMKNNSKGFLYPCIDTEHCAHCGLCHNVCPVNSHTGSIRSDSIRNGSSNHDSYNRDSCNRDSCHHVSDGTSIYALRAKDAVKLDASQSGGAFTLFAEYILSNGGIVYGAALSDNLTVNYIRIDNVEQLYRLKGSKYVQAATKDSFNQVKQDLENGLSVLFSGTSCHIDGLIHYLKGTDCSHLFTCDLVCHGVPSPEIFRRFTDYLISQHGPIHDFRFRDKCAAGWHKNCESWRDESDALHVSQDYAAIFSSNLAMRECCYSCPYASFDKPADITIGDFWGVENVYPDMDDNHGVSIAICRTAKGHNLFNSVKESCTYRPLTADQCMQPQLHEPIHRPDRTDIFWNNCRTADFRYILQSAVQNRYNQNIEQYLINKWLESDNIELKATEYFKEHNMTVCGICGSIPLSYLAICAFNRYRQPIGFYIDIYDTVHYDTFSGIPVISLEDFNPTSLSEHDVIIVADEHHYTSYLQKLCDTGLPIEAVIPLSQACGDEL